MFQGRVALRLTGVEDEAATEIPVGAGQLARIGRAGGLPAVSVLRGGAMPACFARRVFLNASPKPPAVDQFATGRWLKGIGAEVDGPLVAVGADESGVRGQENSRELTAPGAPTSPHRPEGEAKGGGGGRSPAGVTYTYRTSFAVANVLPKTAVVRVRFLAKGCVSGFRFNGQSISAPVFDDRKLRDAGCFVARRDRVRSLNTVEIDVTGGTPAPDGENVMLLGITITGIHPPQSAAPMGAAHREGN